MGLHILVLAGGSGTRLWPLSRRSTPKHLLPLAPGGETLLRSTVERVTGLGQTIRVVTAANQAPGCRAALAGMGLPDDAIIEEPHARGTGPALALAVGLIEREDPDALIASVHADHRVSDRDAYRAAVIASAGWASRDRRARDRRARSRCPGDGVRVHRGGGAASPRAMAPARGLSPCDRRGGGGAPGIPVGRLQGEAVRGGRAALRRRRPPSLEPRPVLMDRPPLPGRAHRCRSPGRDHDRPGRRCPPQRRR